MFLAFFDKFVLISRAQNRQAKFNNSITVKSEIKAAASIFLPHKQTNKIVNFAGLFWTVDVLIHLSNWAQMIKKG